jgi:hypothetical protein
VNVLVALCGAALAACNGHATTPSQPPTKPSQPLTKPSQPTNTMDNANTNLLAGKLMAGDYGKLFIYPQHDMTIERIWSAPGNPEALEALVKDAGAPGKARFLAAEVLFARDVFFIERAGRAAVARLYAEALVGDYTGLANSWGLLWEHNDVGEVGGRFLVLGEAAIPALTELLDDGKVVDNYEGSEEATIGNRYQFTIADFAAYYLSRIAGIAVPFHRTPAERRAEIAKLKDQLRKR